MTYRVLVAYLLFGGRSVGQISLFHPLTAALVGVRSELYHRTLVGGHHAREICAELTVGHTSHTLVPDPPENCHLTVKKFAKNLTFFQKQIAKNFHFFQKNCHWQFFEKK